MFKLKLGFTVLLSSILPIGFLIKLITAGGMYGLFFKKFPPAVYISFHLILNLAIAYAIVLIFIKKSDLTHRLPKVIPGQILLLTGSIIILLPQILRIFTSMIQGGGASYALMAYAAPLIILGKLLLFVGAIKVLMSVKPSEKYEYS